MWEIIISSLPSLIEAMLKYTIPLALISFAFGMIIAIGVALIKFLNPKINGLLSIFWKLLRLVANFYVWIFRSTPLLVQLFIIFFGLPSIGIKLPPFTAAVIGFSLNTGAYGSETIRSALMSVSKDQWDAAYTLGFSTPQTLWRIIMPQAFRIVLPPLSNEFIGLVKDTSLASTITIAEMFQVSQQIAAQNFQPLLMYVEVAALYAFLCTILSVLQHYLENRSSKFIKGDGN
ncbi:cysteine ABC transporter permease [Fructilactobacillus lindneri]|uniref:L-cystine transport system permease tcyB n=2 Tax=Fructilactobacillus lindneri TaxID=53444 RepID=A0A0R2K329_9LACO|nr:amino acid ABC transporter permease [Fructilactobacillus lindneri]ANZ58069.1 cysteine ABC transporter permease [Fructilactobacillus lindneri]ANZ59390.1 cysteine ABC transporter permease [Fructilactobacillus lindneri]KRN80823.1 L-cystine transport system permease tcyB [Fructilactobacillus lindneri DSM 20690 = JCM 11027]POG98826.1 cysteine ABC transporter permease [Fructilactobacillus lindneri]POH03099.1 cysteine ABC transporter permease [Fructilactobacillus lindneri]